jgi:predicted CoA-binding protein
MVDDIPGLRRILKTSKVIAVVGLSGDWYRPSYFAAKYMIEHGYTVIPVNPRYDAILGQKSYESLRDIPVKVDIVDCFRKTQDIMPIAEDAIAIGARVLWQQIGVLNVEAAKKAEAAGLETVMDRCVKIEHGRLFGGLNWCGVNTKVISAAMAVVLKGGFCRRFMCGKASQARQEISYGVPSRSSLETTRRCGYKRSR